MFEDSLMESGGMIKTKSKYWSIVTLILNGAVLIVLIIWPLFHLESLPSQMMATLLVAPPPPPPPPPHHHPRCRLKFSSNLRC
jgi:protein TonB